MHQHASGRGPAAVAAIVAVLVAGIELAGQQEGFRFRSGVDLVNVTATVSDESGRFATGLTRDDFTVYEDDQPVEVTHFSAARVPVSLGLVLDASGSMEGEKLANARLAIEKFLDQLDPEDEVFLYRFSGTGELVQDWTSDRVAVSNGFRRIRANGDTAMYDAAMKAVHKAQGGRNQKKAIVLISDGNDTSSRTTAAAVAQIVSETEVLVYAVGIDGRAEPTIFRPVVPQNPRPRPPNVFPPFPAPRGGFPLPGPGRRRPPALMSDQLPAPRRPVDALNVAALREMTDGSGGRTEIVRDARDLDGATASIADELGRQYYLGYSSPSRRDGRWHTIRVEVRDGALRVRARRGYVATS